ncbi:MAG: ABC transporter substrate-binding protein [Chloroflexota bacterium]|nr:ABC transporter substrate-binding protein [Chloroflexota bacterium]
MRTLSRRRFLRGCVLPAAGLALTAACAPQTAPATSAEGRLAAPATPRSADTTRPATAAPTNPAASTGGAAASEAPNKGGHLDVGLSVDALTLDPHVSGSETDRQVLHNIYEPLVMLGEKLDVRPGLAESWQQIDDHTLVFKLRQGVKFHDGADFGAEAARFNFDRMQDPDTNSARRAEIANVESAEVVDAYTLRLNLKRPDAALLAALTDRAGMMISPAAVQKFGSDLRRNPVGTGPFRFVEWAKDHHLTLDRFDGYWDMQSGPYLDRVQYRPIVEDAVRLQGLRAGEIDIIDYVAPRELTALKGDASAAVVEVPSLASFGYQLNLRKAPFDKKPLRQALAYAVDTEAIVRDVWLGLGVPSNGPLAPASWAYDASIKPIKRDVARVRQLLSEGGMPNGYSFTLTTDRRPLSIHEAEAIKAMLAEAGIQMEIESVDDAALLADGSAGQFDMISYRWSGRADPDGNLSPFFRTAQGPSLNWAGYSNPKVDDLLEKAREVSDRAERTKLYSKLVRTLQDDAPWLFVIHPLEAKAFRPTVRGYSPVPDGVIRVKDVWLKEDLE